MVREREAMIAERDVSLAARDAAIASHERTLRERDALIGKLTHELARLRRVQFAAKSERMDAVQRGLFDEAMAEDIAAVEAQLEAAQATGVAPRPKAPRPAPTRRALPPELARVTTIHAPARCDCATCGAALVKIGEHVSEKLDAKPIELFVRREVYPQYACRTCQTVVAEPVAPAIIDRGLAAPGLLAQVVIQKYVDHLPLYRQEAIYARHGLTLPRTTLAEWIGKVGLALQPLVDALRARLLAAPVLHADETPVAQLDPGAGKTRRAYLFVYRSTGPQPIVLFDYGPTRAGKHAAAFLGDWKGALMVDDYAGYKALFAQGVTELACWAHARRKFFDAHAISGSPVAKEALERIGAIYAIEAELRTLDPDARHRERQRYLAPRLAALKRWLTDLQPKVLGNTGLAGAIGYTQKRWDALARILADGRHPIDNNPAENAIRPIAVGRKNWLFAGSETAGKRAAAIMGLLATAKANGLEPHAWLVDVLTRLPTTKDRDIATLLPLA
ncbi:IS66 family transposase [Frateuria defendens]|uniref:IS66 family transposase n=1 Tax=Frateuria defendens TaxID=2219559 RepID=UPI0009E2EFAA